MPSPEQLGVGRSRTATASSVDWNTVYQQLDRFGALGIQRQHLPSGGYRVACLLPTGQPDRQHRIDVEAASEAEAVRLTLEKVAQWAGGDKVTR